MLSLVGYPTCGYARASSDPAAKTSQAGRSVESQDAEIKACGSDLGVNLIEVYCDNNLAASENATKVRDDWVRMNADIAAGRYKLIILWDCSRGSRDLGDWVVFLKLLRDQSVLVHLITHDRTYDPRNHRDWKILVQEGVEAHSQASMISDNVKRGNKRARQKGRPHGHAPFGWRRVYDPESGKMITQEPVEEEQPQLTEMFVALVSGKKRISIAKDLNLRIKLPEGHPDRAFPTRTGGLWRHDNVGSLLLSPTHIGKLRDHESGDLVEGNWEGTIPEDLWWAAQAILSEKKPHATALKYLLTNIARCGVCGSWMAVQGRKGRPVLACRGVNDRGSLDGRGQGHTTIRMDWVDEFVIDFVLRGLSDAKLLRAVAEDAGEKRQEALTAAKRMKAELEEMWSKVEAREPGYKHDRVAALEAKWEPEIQQLEQEAAAGLGTGRMVALELASLLEESGATGDDVIELLRDAWDETPLDGRREVVRLFTGSIRVMPRQQRGKHFDASRILIEGRRLD